MENLFKNLEFLKKLEKSNEIPKNPKNPEKIRKNPVKNPVKNPEYPKNIKNYSKW